MKSILICLIRSFQYEKKEIIKDVVDEKLDDDRPIKDQLGIPFYRANAILNQYWERFLQLGVSHSDMLKMDWGEPKDAGSIYFHKIITEAIIKGDFETFCRIKNKYPTKKYYHKEFGECDLVYFPNYASIFYNDEIIGTIDITTELGFSFITESEFECG